MKKINSMTWLSGKLVLTHRRLNAGNRSDLNRVAAADEQVRNYAVQI
jgi:hypothetical protein